MFLYHIHSLKKLKIKAFSFVEIGIVLLIIGILIGGIFKGKDLIDTAKGYTVAGEIHKILQIIATYREQYQELPGDDPNANRFGADVKSGNGNHIIDNDEATLFWIHLYKAGLLEDYTPPPTKFGGQYTVSSDDQKNLWLIMSSKDGGGVLTPKQAQKIKSKLQSSVNDSSIQIKNGKNTTTCIASDGTLNLLNDESSCIVRIKIKD